MKITLVTASFNDLVHGTYNDKKTACGINLMKPETASRYRKGGEMNYLGELTCEKCKAKIAKEMIKADSKEMKALLKEEKARAKKGMDDEGLVQLSELAVKPTSTAPPEPEYNAPTTENVQANTDNYTQSAPPQPSKEESDDDFLKQFAIKKPVEEPEPPAKEESDDDFLAQFAIKKPTEEPVQPAEEPEEEDFLAQFAIKKPTEEPELPAEEPEEEDFLAQFAINKPAEEAGTPEKDDSDDFLAQFSVSSSENNTSYDEEPAPPVIDDISDALSAMQNNPALSQKQENKADDDILSMFSIDNSAESEKTNSTDYINMDDDDESLFDSMYDTNSDSASEWDNIANKIFDEQQTPPVIDDISVPEIEDITAPVTDRTSVPEIEDIAVPAIDDIAIPEIEDITAPVADNTSVPEIDDIAVPAIDDIAIPSTEIDAVEIPSAEIDDIAIPAPEIPTTKIEDIKIPATETPKPAPEPVSAKKQKQSAPKQTAPKQPVSQPVQPAPVQTVPVTPPPVAPMPQPAPAIAGMNMGMGQIVTVPQITGYDQNGQPVYAYMQMILQGYDQNGQPIMMPMPQMSMPMPQMGMPMQMPAQPAQPEYSSLDKNSRLQAVLDSLDEPVAEKDMTIGQKIAAADAAKGSPVTANVSKIATNPHSKSTSQAFINAISESKDDTKSLTESQGLKPKSMVLDSIEDVLSQLGDDSLKKKKEAEAKMNKNVPTYEEFKTPSRQQSSSFSRPIPSSSRPSSSSSMSDLPLTKAQQKELKKQQKIDAKFQKEMAKRKK